LKRNDFLDFFHPFWVCGQCTLFKVFEVAVFLTQQFVVTYLLEVIGLSCVAQTTTIPPPFSLTVQPLVEVALVFM
jgi:hypothetical protein